MIAARLRQIAAVLCVLGFVTGALVACDPVVNIAGANFPAWLICAIAGAILAASLRPAFVVTGIEPYLGPVMLIYPCLAILLGCAVYLMLFNRI
jgi:hypothetical protein